MSNDAAQKVGDQRRGRGSECNHDQGEISIRQNHCNCRADDGGEQTSGGVEDGGNRHGAEYGIGNIIEEAAQKRRANLFPEDGEGQHADEIGDHRHHCNIDDDTHVALASCSSGTGNSNAPAAAAATAQMITANPLDTAGNP